VHNLYQRASYSAAARRNQGVTDLLPELANALARQPA
jgi:hypothetical protein